MQPCCSRQMPASLFSGPGDLLPREPSRSPGLSAGPPMDLPDITVLAPAPFPWRAMPAHDNVAGILKRDDLGPCPQPGNPRNSPGFFKRIEPVETDIEPACDLAKTLLPLSPCHLDKADRRGKGLEERAQVMLVSRDLLQTVHGKNVRSLFVEDPESKSSPCDDVPLPSSREHISGDVISERTEPLMMSMPKTLIPSPSGRPHRKGDQPGICG